jgi:hypothetical protein
MRTLTGFIPCFWRSIEIIVLLGIISTVIAGFPQVFSETENMLRLYYRIPEMLCAK